MKATLFNDEWKFWEVTNSFALNWAPPQDARVLDLPHDAMIEIPQDPQSRSGSNSGYRKGGVFSYSKSFYAASPQRTYILKIEGAYMNAFVFVNGQLAAKRPLGYAVFYVPLDPYLDYEKENEIRIQVRSGAEPNSRWYPGTGLYRDVYLLESGMQYIKPDSVQIRTIKAPLAGSASAADAASSGFTGSSGAIHLTLSGSPSLNAGKDTAQVRVNALAAVPVGERPGTVEVRITSPDGENAATAFTSISQSPVSRSSAGVTAPSPADQIFLDGPDNRKTLYYPLECTLSIPQPLLWSAETPFLYTCTLTMKNSSGEIVDTHQDTFGIRTLTVSSSEGLRVNGQEVKLRGTCIHHDSGILGARTFEETHIRQIMKLKESGFNAIRCAHNPAAPALLRACDKVGMYVMDEAFDIWTRHKSDYDYGLFFEEWWEADIESMVRNAFNHPSVIMYSIGNEIPEIGTPQGGKITKMLCDKIRSLDETRFTTAAVNGIFSVGDGLDQIVHDVASELQSQGKIDGNVNDFMAFMHTYMDDMTRHPIVDQVISVPFEYTDIAGYNYMGDRYELDGSLHPDRVIVGSETGIVNIAENWEQVMKLPYLIGDFCWTGWEYLGESGIGMPNYDGASNPFGNSAFPLQISGTGCIDITGSRLPMSYYREIIFGLRKDPYIAVQDPVHYGEGLIRNPWLLSDAIGSWSFRSHAGKPVVVEVYSGSEEVELLKNGVSLGTRKVGEQIPYMALFETEWEEGTLTAISRDGGEETGRWELASCEEELQLIIEEEPDYKKMAEERAPKIPKAPEPAPSIFDSVVAQVAAQASLAAGAVQVASGTGADAEGSGCSTKDAGLYDSSPASKERGRLHFLRISLADQRGIVDADREATLQLTVNGNAQVLGFGSADPWPSFNYDSMETKTYHGTALLIVRTVPGQEPATISITAEYGNVHFNAEKELEV